MDLTRTITAEGERDMIARNNWKSMTKLAVVLTLTLAVPAWAEGGFGPPHDGPGFGPPHGGGFGPGFGPRAPGLLTQLIFPCQAGCSSTARDCADAADSAALTCVSGACAAEIDTAQTACAADRTSADCHDAIDALRTCAASCLTTRQSALTT